MVPLIDRKKALEKDFSKGMVDALNLFRDIRDVAQEVTFKTLYGNFWMKSLFPPMEAADPAVQDVEKRSRIKKQIEKEAENGGFIEAAVRVILALLNADRIFERSEYEAAETIVLDHKELRKVDPFDMKRIVKQQAMILQADEEVALEVLPKMLKNKSRRKEVLRIAEQVLSLRGDSPNREEAAIAQKIKKILS